MHLVHSLRDVLQDQVQVDLILIKKYVIAFADQYESTLLWPKRLRITVCI